MPCTHVDIRTYIEFSTWFCCGVLLGQPTAFAHTDTELVQQNAAATTTTTTNRMQTVIALKILALWISTFALSTFSSRVRSWPFGSALTNDLEGTILKMSKGISFYLSIESVDVRTHSVELRMHFRGGEKSFAISGSIHWPFCSTTWSRYLTELYIKLQPCFCDFLRRVWILGVKCAMIFESG